MSVSGTAKPRVEKPKGEAPRRNGDAEAVPPVPPEGPGEAEAVKRKPRKRKKPQMAAQDGKADGGKPPPSPSPKFEMREGGLYRFDDKAEEWRWVAPPFEILGRCREPRDEQGISHGWGLVIRFRDLDAVLCDVIIANAALYRDVGVLASELADKGFMIGDNPAAMNAFAACLRRVSSKRRILLAARTGWLLVEDSPVFILPNEVIGAARQGGQVQLRASARAPYEVRGTLADWRRGVGWLAQGNRLAVLAISTALASTLLWLAGYESGGVHLYGPSSIGKTTIAKLNASVWGRPGEGGWLRSWRTTANAVEGTLAGACDAGLPFDEVAQAEAASFSEMIYGIAAGQGKIRMRRDASLRESMTWRVLVLSTGEFPIETKLSETAASRFGGVKHRGGQSVRLVDIKAERVCGVFDDVKQMKPADFVAECQREAMANYGTAGPAFVAALIERGITGDDVRNRVTAFVDNLRNAKDEKGQLKWPVISGQVERVAQRLGLIAAAGELASEFDIVPWPSGEATRAAAQILAEWLQARGGASPHEERQAVRQVRLFIERYGESRFDDLGGDDGAQPALPGTREGEGKDSKDSKERRDRPAPDRAGWREGEGEGRRWYVPSEVWRKGVCAGLDPDFVARTLIARRILETETGRLTKLKWLSGTGKPVRVYVVTPAIFDAEAVP